MMLSAMFLIAAASVAQADVHQSDLSPFAKSSNYTQEFQWKAIEACPRISVRSGQTGSGSAVIVAIKDGHAWALSAAHVVHNGAAFEAEMFLRTSYPAPNYTLGGVKIVAQNATADLVLMKIPLDEQKAPPPPVLKLAQPGVRPKKFPFPALSIGCDDGFSTRCYDVNIQGKHFRPESSKAAFFWESKETSGHGRSGGPLLDKSGNVIGICAANMDGMGYFAYCDEIHAWLKSSGNEWIWKDESGK